MALVPDDKDWTWVLHRECPECGLEAGLLSVDAIAPLLRETASRWDAILQGGAGLRARPNASTWSPLEYACHVRDVLRLYDARLALMLTEVDPTFANWDQDATAVEDDYGAQRPDTVRTELADAAAILGRNFDRVNGEQWERRGRRSDGAEFTVASFGRYFIHDPVHHLWDVNGERSSHSAAG